MAGQQQEAGDALAASEAKCPICLEDTGAPTAGPDSVEVGGVQQVQRCGVCQTTFHRACACTTVMAAVEEGGPLRLPMRCPVPGCSAEWPVELIAWALDEGQLMRYHTACGAAEELRSAAAGCSGSDAPPPDSPRTVETLRRLGVRSCPQCRSLIQKQAEGLLTGCDKMTCRCGCMFCFQCGIEARAGGVARCRCVGNQHNFIPQSNVLSNYRGESGFGSAADEDLTKRKKGKATKQTLARLKKELKDIQADPPPFVHVRCEQANSLAWSFVIQGPVDTPYEGGWYWGRLEVSKEYPFWPPLIRILTPNGRFEPDQWLCRTLADYHPEGWQPAWSLAGLLMALATLMVADAFTPGAVHPPAQAADVRLLAQKSLEWNKAQPDFMKEFPDIDVLVASAAMSAASVAGAEDAKAGVQA
mmetsp:Transcript_23283/g.55416  ORF Transcript_23283/g.55416 Transcript_23283/m.55416 type:complete len:416 (-) Transcript_23283:75-1322(-)|eukprot:CAMPEP_0177730166 /NCGR_PEP_ID=MMETSP0484_2-20121128/21834_1 /TAXON_ID=354590 /ORGANISM="Rhodomonas lens, Strain RHODO" /LENGTH=415 /DNA_ID=CAMNT_0019243117 /DNA_START=3 /DNA_END=1250 /DNA_ORIENTATION=-